MSNLKEGDLAPEFKGGDRNGNEISLSGLKGKKIILYFYPKDNTPGCTAEACNLRDNFSELTSNGFEVIGVSADSEKSHQKFIGRYELPFKLVSDTDKEILRLYGVLGTKKMFGKEYEGTLRKTFVIDEDGKIIRIFDKVDTKHHAEQILEALK